MKKKKKKDLLYCPKCENTTFKEISVEGNLRSEYFSWGHNALQCKKCGCEFTIWGAGF